MADDERADTRWLSYEELAAARGIDVESARRIARLKKWPRRKGNEGGIRVAVPADILADGQTTRKRRIREKIRPAIRPDASADESRTINELSARITLLQAQLEKAEAQAAEARATATQAMLDREDARVRAASAEGEAKALRSAIDRLEQRLDDVEADRRGEHANWQAARDRLLVLVEWLVAAGAKARAHEAVERQQPVSEPPPAVTPIEAAGPSFARWFAALVQRRRAERRQKP